MSRKTPISAETPPGDGDQWAVLRDLMPYLWPAGRPDLKARVVLAIALPLCIGLARPLDVLAYDVLAIDGARLDTQWEVLAAIAFAVRELKLVVEPGGAAALAALLAGKIETQGRTTMVVVTGGNIDPAMLARAVGAI